VTHRLRLTFITAVLLFLVLFAFWPSGAASDVPGPISGFGAIGTAGITVVGTNNPSPAVPELRTLSTATVPASAVSVTPSVRAVPRLASVRSSGEPQCGQSPSPVVPMTGIISWFRSPTRVSSAGPALRAALGPSWRGTVIRVTGPAGSAVVVLGDWMHRDRLIDLDAPLFVRVCGPLGRGLCHVTIERRKAP